MVINWIGNNTSCHKITATIAQHNFLRLVLHVIRPFVASGNFVSPILFFLFTTLLGTKGQLDRFRFFLEDSAEILLHGLSGHDKIGCGSKDGM